MAAGLISGLAGSAAGGAAAGAGAGLASGAAGSAAATGAATSALSQAGSSGGGGKGGWLGTGLFGNDKYNPNPSTYAPEVGSAQSAMPNQKTQTPIAMSLLGQLPITDPALWNV